MFEPSAGQAFVKPNWLHEVLWKVPERLEHSWESQLSWQYSQPDRMLGRTHAPPPPQPVEIAPATSNIETAMSLDIHSPEVFESPAVPGLPVTLGTGEGGDQRLDRLCQRWMTCQRAMGSNGSRCSPEKVGARAINVTHQAWGGLSQRPGTAVSKPGQNTRRGRPRGEDILLSSATRHTGARRAQFRRADPGQFSRALKDRRP